MNTYQDYVKQMSKIADINHSIAVLSWDKEVYMPKDGSQHRSQQIATLTGISHELFTSSDFGNILKTLSTDQSLDYKQKRNITISLKEYDRATKFDEEFVIEKSKTTSETFEAWLQAREENDWTVYAKALEKLVIITKEESKRLRIGEHPYDAMLDIYEPGMTVAKLDVIFEDVKKKLLPLIKKINNGRKVNNDFLFEKYDTDKQWQYGLDILKNMGYDFNKGRQDISQHPFTTSFSPNDARVTTRLSETDFPMMLWSCIHEGGHALYEQGLPVDQYGLPSGSYVSLGIHESQSRLWENNVGRSLPYWEHQYPILQKTFPETLKNFTVQDFYSAMNKIEPNLIRTEADELHYHFHVMIRYEIEKELMEGKIEVSELREIWNNKYEQYLGLRPKSDKDGILQDIHWALGSFGYFPTYSLGSFYAAQFYNQAKKDIPNLEKEIRKGNNNSLLKWLRNNIHKHGHSYEAEELCQKITGKGLELDDFMEYVIMKFSSIYT